MSPLLEHHLYALFASIGALLRRPISAAMTVLVMAISLALPTALYVLLVDLSHLSDGVDLSSEATVFMTRQAGEAEVNEASQTFLAMPGVVAVTTLSPTEAWEDFKAADSFAAALDAIADNPLPHVLLVRLERTLTPAATASLLVDLERHSLVDAAQFDMAWLIRFNALLRVAERLVMVLGGLLAVALVMIIGNTIRLDIESRRDEIEITMVLGATNAFVRRPFLYSGFWHGVLAAVVAWALIAIGVALLREPISNLAAAYEGQFRLSGLGLVEALVMLASAAAIGWIGAWLAVSRHIRRIKLR